MSDIIYTGGIFFGVFAGMGLFLFFCVASALVFQITRKYKQEVDKENLYCLAEENLLHKTFKKIDLNVYEYIARREVATSKTIREILEEKAIEELTKESKNK